MLGLTFLVRGRVKEGCFVEWLVEELEQILLEEVHLLVLLRIGQLIWMVLLEVPLWLLKLLFEVESLKHLYLHTETSFPCATKHATVVIFNAHINF